jgi:hypothetical protein
MPALEVNHNGTPTKTGTSFSQDTNICSKGCCGLGAAQQGEHYADAQKLSGDVQKISFELNTA